MARPKKTNGGTNQKKPIEQYDHKGKRRANNPPVGLVTPQTDRDQPAKKYAYDPHLDPQLVWAGKAERTSFEVPTVSLHVHERIDPRTIIEAVRKRNGSGQPMQGSLLFERKEENPPLREAIDFYRHPHGWSNRLIAGDSLLVMNSLLEKEGMAGQVQMVYIDPPYGIRYKSNFQPFVNKRDMAETDRDEELTQEPEMIRAFRDTWELGIHSYLTYLRDRLWLVKELLDDSGSCFLQISDENLHLVRAIMDEVFGPNNLVVTIPVKKKGSQKSSLMDPVNDYLLWFSKTARDESGLGKLKFRRLFARKELDAETLSEYKMVELPDGTEFPVAELPDPEGIVRDYRLNPQQIFRDYPGARLFRSNPLTSGGERKNQSLPYKFNGKTFHPGPGNCWKTTVQTDDGSTPGMDRLRFAGRLMAGAGQLRFRSYFDDFGYEPISNWWDSLGGAPDPIYVVQTNSEIVQRCMLMTTGPGDIVLDPTCGSGTTAFVAEQWGRRWITCDTSRVALALARQRLMTALYDYYELAHPQEGVGSGFNYKTASHVMLKSIANNPEIIENMSRDVVAAVVGRNAEREPLYDRPETDRSRARVSGPFTVEAVPAPTVKALSETSETEQPDVSIARSGETLRQSEWRDVLLRGGVRGRRGQMIEFSRVEPFAGTRWLHADAETKGVKPERVAVSFGPEYAPLEQRQVELAWEEARQLSPRPSILLFVYSDIDPEAGKDISELAPEKTGMTFLSAKIDADVWTKDLKKKARTSPSVWLVGQPEADLRKITKGEHQGKWQVEVLGFDYYDTKTGKIESGDTSKIALWLLDPDYDGRSLYPRQVFFPMADKDGAWARLARNLKAEIDPQLIEAYQGTVSLPFEPGQHKRVAVKIVDDRGIESLKIIELN